MFKFALIVGAGGFVGSITRYLLSKLVQEASQSAFPYGTLIVNISGCLLIGFILGIAEKSTWMSPELRMFLMVGICGGYTTFSTFAAENLNMMRDGQFYYILIYTSLSVLTCLIAVYLGHLASKII